MNGQSHPVRIVSFANGNGINSIDKVAASYRRALDAVDVPSVLEHVPIGRGAKVGGKLLPWIRMATTSNNGGRGISHAVEPSIAFRGTDVTTLHTCYYGSRLPPGENHFWDNTVALQTRLMASHSKIVACVSQFTESEAKAMLPWRQRHKVRYLPNPFEVRAYRLPATADTFWVGTSIPRKRFWLYAEAMKLLPELQATARYNHFVAYPREHHRSMRAAKEARIRLIDRLTEEELDRTYRSTRCVVSTSTYEGLHSVPLEAWLRGTPVVIPKIAAYDGMFLEDHPAGVYWYRDGDPIDLAFAIGSAVRDPGFEPNRRAVEHYSYANVGRRMQAIYDEVAG